MRDYIRSRCVAAAQRTVLTVVIVASVPVTALAEARAPVPDSAAQAQAQQLVRDVFGEAYEAAETSAQKTELARKLLDQATKSKANPASHFVLLRIAKDVAALAGDAETALEAADRITNTYDVDPVKTKLECLESVARSAKLSSQLTTLARRGLLLVDTAVAEEDFAAASKLGEVAQDSARRARDYRLVREVATRLAAVKQAEKDYAEYREALVTLEDKPTDPQANLVAGRYLCLVKGDWAGGIPMLALSSDPAWKELALKELKDATTPDARVALGDGWWDLAQTRKGQERDSLLLRAGHWYQQVQVDNMLGLLKAKLDKRLKEIAKIGQPGADVPTETGPLTKKTEPDFVSLFDGKTLNGWQGDPRLWRVVNGVIVGNTKGVRFDTHSYLITDRSYRDFVLKVKFRLREGNSGIHFRSQQLPDFKLMGPQAEIGWQTEQQNKPNQVIGLYFQGQNRDSKWTDRDQLRKHVNDQDWNEYVITCRGSHITLQVNGHTTVDYVEDQPVTREGFIGFQIRRKPKRGILDMQVEFKDIWIKELTDPSTQLSPRN